MEPETLPIEIVDRRRPSFVWLDKVIISEYLPKIGPTAVAVYLGLLYFKNEQSQKCWPSVGTLSKLLGMAKNTIRAGLRSLKSANLISMDQRSEPDVFFSSYLFTIEEVLPKLTPEPLVDPKPSQSDSAPLSSKVEPRDSSNGEPLIVQKLNPNKTKINKTKEPKEASGFVLPEWVPADAWQRFDEMRKSKDWRAWTDGAKALTIQNLFKLRKSGDDPGEVLDQSVQRGWRGVFALKRDDGEAPEPRPRPDRTPTGRRLIEQYKRERAEADARAAKRTEPLDSGALPKVAEAEVPVPVVR